MTANSIKSSKAFSVFKDSAICIVVLTAATLAGYAFKAFQLADADIIMLYIIAVLVISIFTSRVLLEITGKTSKKLIPPLGVKTLLINYVN